MFVVFATVLCLSSVSYSAPLACEDLVRPLDQLDVSHLEGRWVLVAGSLNNSNLEDILKGRDSVTIDFKNSSYTKAIRSDGHCSYHHLNVSLDGHMLHSRLGSWNLTATFFHTACPDCVVFSWYKESFHPVSYKGLDFYLFSRRKEVLQAEMDEFRAQVNCMNMTPPVVMDTTKKDCPEQKQQEEGKRPPA